MPSLRTVSLSALGLVGLLTTATPVGAEWFADIYLGAAVTQTADVKVTIPGSNTTTNEVKYGSSVNPGLRVGRWLDPLPWLGLALDVSYFGPERDLQVIPISALAMARLQLMKDTEFPKGRVQPYLAAGPGLFISHSDGSAASAGVKDTSVDVGADVRAGLAFLLETNIGLFAEYRFTRVSPSFSFDLAGRSGSGSVDTTFDTHAILLGVSFRFDVGGECP